MTLYINITWIYDENQIKAPAAQETLYFLCNHIWWMDFRHLLKYQTARTVLNYSNAVPDVVMMQR